MAKIKQQERAQTRTVYFETEIIDLKDREDLDQQQSLHKELAKAREQSNEHRESKIESVQRRNQLLRETIEHSFSPEQQGQKERILHNLDTAHAETLDDMHKKGEIDMMDKYAQKYLPDEWSVKTKRQTALGTAVATGVLIGLYALKRLFGKARAVTASVAKKTGGFLRKAAMVTGVAFAINWLTKGALFGGVKAIAGEVKEKAEAAGAAAKEKAAQAGEAVKEKAAEGAKAVKEGTDSALEKRGEVVDDIFPGTKPEKDAAKKKAKETAAQEGENIVDKGVAKEMVFDYRWAVEEVGLDPRNKNHAEELASNLREGAPLLAIRIADFLAIADDRKSAEIVWQYAYGAEPNTTQTELMEILAVGIAGKSKDELQGLTTFKELVERDSLIMRMYSKVRTGFDTGGVLQAAREAFGQAANTFEDANDYAKTLTSKRRVFESLNIVDEEMDKTEARNRITEFLDACRNKRDKSLGIATSEIPKKFQPAIKQMQSFFEKNATALEYLKQYAHEDSDIASAIEKIVKGSDGKPSNLRLHDALQLYSYMHLAQEDYKDDSKSNLSESDSMGAMLVQLKILNLLRRNDPSAANNLIILLGNRVPGASLKIPTGMQKLLQSLLDKGTAILAAKTSDTGRDIKDVVNAQEKETPYLMYGAYTLMTSAVVARSAKRIIQLRTIHKIGTSQETEVEAEYDFLTETAASKAIGLAEEYETNHKILTRDLSTWAGRAIPGASEIGLYAQHAELNRLRIQSYASNSNGEAFEQRGFTEAQARVIRSMSITASNKVGKPYRARKNPFKYLINPTNIGKWQRRANRNGRFLRRVISREITFDQAVTQAKANGLLNMGDPNIRAQLKACEGTQDTTATDQEVRAGDAQPETTKPAESTAPKKKPKRKPLPDVQGFNPTEYAARMQKRLNLTHILSSRFKFLGFGEVWKRKKLFHMNEELHAYTESIDMRFGGKTPEANTARGKIFDVHNSVLSAIKGYEKAEITATKAAEQNKERAEQEAAERETQNQEYVQQEINDRLGHWEERINDEFTILKGDDLTAGKLENSTESASIIESGIREQMKRINPDTDAQALARAKGLLLRAEGLRAQIEQARSNASGKTETNSDADALLDRLSSRPLVPNADTKTVKENIRNTARDSKLTLGAGGSAMDIAAAKAGIDPSDVDPDVTTTDTNLKIGK